MKYMLMFCKSEADDRHFDAMSPEQRGQLFQQVVEWQAEFRSSSASVRLHSARWPKRNEVQDRSWHVGPCGPSAAPQTQQGPDEILLLETQKEVQDPSWLLPLLSAGAG